MESVGQRGRLPGIDLVVPVYNEECILPSFIAALQNQTDQQGQPLDATRFRLIIVDNGSLDRSCSVAESVTRGFTFPSTILLHEPVKSHIQARICGAGYALGHPEQAQFPVLASADADTFVHPKWIDIVARQLADEAVDAVSCAGTFPPTFWRRVPKLTRAYASELGTVFFPQETIEEYGIDPGKTLFTEQIFLDLGRMPSDCAFAFRKTAFVKAGGYFREYWADGREILGEGWNLKFRLDRSNARIVYERRTPYVTSPRRLLHEAERMLAGNSYSEGMSDLRGLDEDRHYEMLEKLADGYDFDSMRRYVVRNYVLLQAITRPSSPELLRYLGPAGPAVLDAIADANARTSNVHAGALSGEIHQLADKLLAGHFDQILANLRQLRG